MTRETQATGVQVLQAIQGVEDRVAQLDWDAGAAVLYGDEDSLAILAGPRLNGYLSLALHRVEGVERDVEQNLLELRFVAKDGG